MLGDEILNAQARGDPDLGDTYYQHWLRALEKIAEAKGLSSANEIKLRARQRHDAYLNTPHGNPVHLGASGD